MAQSGTLFSSDSVSGNVAGAADFVIDSFVDTVLPATNNNALTSNALTNPFGVFIANAEAVQFGVKTLWIKDIKLIEDRSKWINTQPTYEVLFHENYPGIFCYAALRDTPTVTDQFYEPWRIEDPSLKPFYLGSNAQWTFGVTGRFSRVAFLTGKDGITGRLFVDGVDTAALTYMNATFQQASNPYSMFYSPVVHAASNLTDDIHDVRLAPTAATSSNPSIFGIQLFFDNSGSNVQVGPGISYNNKNKLTTTVGTTFAVPSPGSSMGALALYYKDSSDAYATFVTSPGTISTVAQGASGGGLLTVASGHGASFPSGTGFVVSQGSSVYVGSVLSVSTDTLTVSPSLPFGISGALERRWLSGPTLPISNSLMALTYSWIPALSFGFSSVGNPDDPTEVSFYDPIRNIGVYPDKMGFTGFGVGTPMLTFWGEENGLQCVGDFSAAEIEWAGAGYTHPIRVSVNGFFGFTGTYLLGDGITGIGGTTWMSRMSIMDNGGVGLNSFKVYASGLTFPADLGAGIKQINFYKYLAQGATLGVLGALERNQAAAYPANSVTFLPLGLDRRVPPQFFGYTGAWQQFPSIAGVSITVANFVANTEGPDSGSFKYQFYGNAFSILGDPGASTIVMIDGVSTSSDFNVMKDAGSEGWHQIEFQHKSGTNINSSKIYGIDYARTWREIKQTQNYKAVSTRKIAVPIVKDYGNAQFPILGTTNPVKGTAVENAHLRREGRYLFIEYSFNQSVGSADAGTGQYFSPLPLGLQADMKYISTVSSFGAAYVNGGGVLVGSVVVVNNNILIGGLTDGGVFRAWGQGGGNVGALTFSGLTVTYSAKIPIVGWDDYDYIEVNDG